MQYFGGTFQCGILAVFWRYFSVFKTTDTVPIPRYLEKKYRIPTPHWFFPYRWTLLQGGGIPPDWLGLMKCRFFGTTFDYQTFLLGRLSTGQWSWCRGGRAPIYSELMKPACLARSLFTTGDSLSLQSSQQYSLPANFAAKFDQHKVLGVLEFNQCIPLNYEFCFSNSIPGITNINTLCIPTSNAPYNYFHEKCHPKRF